MARLPTRETLGPLPQVRGRRGIAQVSVPGQSAAGRGAIDLGRGVAAIGLAAEAIEEQNRKRDAFDAEHRFQTFDWEQKKALDEAMRTMEPGQARDFAKTTSEQYSEAARGFLASVPEHLKPVYDRKLFDTERTLYGAAAQFGQKEQSRYASTRIDDTVENIYRPQATLAPAGELDKVTGDFDRLVDSNPDLTPIQKDELRHKGRRTIEYSHLSSRSPDEYEALRTARILKAEGTGKNPMSSAEGTGQFINSTWLDMVKRHRPDLAQGKSDTEILALRKDPALGAEMTSAYSRENAGALQKAGLETSPGNVYLAHFLGPGGATKVLTADPNTPVDTLLDPKAIAANKRVLSGKTAGEVAAWAGKRMGGGFSALTEEDWARAGQQVATRARAEEVEAARAAKLQEQQAKEEMEARENEYIAAAKSQPSAVPLGSSRPAPTVAELADDPAFDAFPERRRVLINFMEQAAKERGDSSTYGPKFHDLFMRIHAPGEGRLTDPAELYPLVGNGLTVSGMEKLRGEMSGRKTPEGAALADLRKNFFSMARRTINPTANEAFGMSGDAADEERYQKFLVMADREYQEKVKAGKSPSSMFDPDSSDYLGKMIEPLKSKRKFDLSDPTQKPDFTSITDPVAGRAALQLAVSKGMSFDEAKRIGLDRGWFRPAAPTVAPPISQ